MTERAWYSMADLAEMLGKTRAEVRRLVLGRAVKVHWAGTKMVVGADALREAFPELFEVRPTDTPADRVDSPEK